MQLLTTGLVRRVEGFLDEILASKDILGGGSNDLEKEVEMHSAIEIILRRSRNKRLLINRMPTDIIHLIFSFASSHSQIHDPSTTLIVLGEHRKQIFIMRCVCTLWNDFIVSGSQYWQVINLRTPSGIIQSSLKRAENAPLCVYSIENKDRRSKEVVQLEATEKYLLDSITHIRTIRSEEPRFLPLWKALLKQSTPLLETLKLTARNDWSGLGSNFPIAEWLVNDLPIIRNVTARGWQPSPDAIWLGNLRSLAFRAPMLISSNLLNALTRCTGLLKLRIEGDGDDSWQADATAQPKPSKIAFPNLQILELELEPVVYIRYLVRQLEVPRETHASLRLVHLPHSEELVEDLAYFICPPPPDGAKSIKPPSTATVEVHTISNHNILAIYISGTRSVAFKIDPLNQWPDQPTFEHIITTINGRLNKPQISVQVDPHSGGQAEVLRILADLNCVKSLCISNKVSDQCYLDMLIAAIADPCEFLPSGISVPGEQFWPFEALRELIFENVDGASSEVVKLVGKRWRYLKASKGRWLDRVVLKGCLGGLSLARTGTNLEGMGVELFVDGCKYSEKD
ncbi:hypothetical protein FRB90_002273 [Tulasnella sp. 427]|nr:hypothetical protein FRB90_002273 [Tulasnella sp. 427]